MPKRARCEADKAVGHHYPFLVLLSSSRVSYLRTREDKLRAKRMLRKPSRSTSKSGSLTSVSECRCWHRLPVPVPSVLSCSGAVRSSFPASSVKLATDAGSEYPPMFAKIESTKRGSAGAKRVVCGLGPSIGRQ
ncbi:hypothetical protein CSUI_010536 [Cystoisospora suis]|uniref:Uncharacterized protein n=1 Tax=Cystoisospora suis TaxID=483139 RepID=A0A2C6KEU4_9APIC|nr:hypothetical protein CSUI_010536 [Cystoisospora suis]